MILICTKKKHVSSQYILFQFLMQLYFFNPFKEQQDQKCFANLTLAKYQRKVNFFELDMIWAWGWIFEGYLYKSLCPTFELYKHIHLITNALKCPIRRQC